MVCEWDRGMMWIDSDSPDETHELKPKKNDFMKRIIVQNLFFIFNLYVNDFVNKIQQIYDYNNNVYCLL